MQWVGLNQLPRGTLSLPPVVVKLCQKSNHRFQLAQVGCLRGYLSRDVLSLPLAVKTNSLRYLPSAMVMSDKNSTSIMLPCTYQDCDVCWPADNLNCDFCQRNKLGGKGYGFLPEHEMCLIPFEKCAVNLIGPWIVQFHRRPYQFEAFDVLIQDPKSSQVKIPSQDPKSRSQVKIPSHDPKPKTQDMCCFLLFFSCLFEKILYGEWLLAMVLNSQGQNRLKILIIPKNIDEALPIAMHAMSAGIHTTLGSSPRSLTCNRDMILNIPLIADWHTVTHRWDLLKHEKIIREYQQQRCYDYVPQQLVLKKKWKPCKLGEKPVDHTGFYRHM